jgi:hypothetical protein
MCTLASATRRCAGDGTVRAQAAGVERGASGVGPPPGCPQWAGVGGGRLMKCRSAHLNAPSTVYEAVDMVMEMVANPPGFGDSDSEYPTAITCTRTGTCHGPRCAHPQHDTHPTQRMGVGGGVAGRVQHATNSDHGVLAGSSQQLDLFCRGPGRDVHAGHGQAKPKRGKLALSYTSKRRERYGGGRAFGAREGGGQGGGAGGCGCKSRQQQSAPLAPHVPPKEYGARLRHVLGMMMWNATREKFTWLMREMYTESFALRVPMANVRNRVPLTTCVPVAGQRHTR